jgi:hypothetical protein
MQNSPANSASTSSTEYPLPDFRNSIFSSIPYPVVLASYYQYSSTYLFIFPSKLPQTSCALPLAVIYCQHNTAAKRVESMNNQAYCQIAPEKISHPEVVEQLRRSIILGENSEDTLWQAVTAYQQHQFFTSSGLPFSYTLHLNKQGKYTAELLISRKEGSKTLTRSSILLAFDKVLQDSKIQPDSHIIPPEYKGPKAIGQIFGISYVYSLFYEFGLIKVPIGIATKMSGEFFENQQKILDIWPDI